MSSMNQENRAHRPRNLPVKVATSDGAAKQRKAFKKLSPLEIECEITPAEYEAFHAEQRARVLKRWAPVMVALDARRPA